MGNRNPPKAAKGGKDYKRWRLGGGKKRWGTFSRSIQRGSIASQRRPAGFPSGAAVRTPKNKKRKFFDAFPPALHLFDGGGRAWGLAGVGRPNLLSRPPPPPNILFGWFKRRGDRGAQTNSWMRSRMVCRQMGQVLSAALQSMQEACPHWKTSLMWLSMQMGQVMRSSICR